METSGRVCCCIALLSQHISVEGVAYCAIDIVVCIKAR